MEMQDEREGPTIHVSTQEMRADPALLTYEQLYLHVMTREERVKGKGSMGLHRLARNYCFSHLTEKMKCTVKTRMPIHFRSVYLLFLPQCVACW